MPVVGMETVVVAAAGLGGENVPKKKEKKRRQQVESGNECGLMAWVISAVERTGHVPHRQQCRRPTSHSTSCSSRYRSYGETLSSPSTAGWSWRRRRRRRQRRR
jgi:hypothetical protein